MAKRFRFRLEVVRKLRKRTRDVQRLKLARAVGTKAETETRIADLEQLRERVMAESTVGRRANLLDVAALRSQSVFHGWLCGRISKARMELEGRLRDVERERKALAAVSAQFKAIEDLRMRQWQRHQRNLRKDEQTENDEAGAQLVVRRVVRPSWEQVLS